jgi:hypothetical protein
LPPSTPCHIFQWEMRRRRTPIEDLRTAIDCLPVHTREAMLDGIRQWPIIVGAYTDRRGGVCPMLAAHRCGGRTNFLAFARAWDRYTHAKRPRRATEREVGTLIAHLESSLLGDPTAEFERAIAEHQETARGRREREAARVGWSWLWRPEQSDEGDAPERDRELV